MTGINLKTLDLNLLVVFEAIYSAGNISHAATQLAMSQPAVSNSLARLRELLNDPLFLRGRRGVQPTTKAQSMIGPVREALGLIGTQLGGLNDTDLASYKRTFRICPTDVYEPILIPPLLNRLAELAPGISIEGVIARPEIVQDIIAGTVDLVCFTFPVTSPEISIVPIGPLDLVVIARRNHPRIGTKLEAAAMNDSCHVALSADLRGFTQIDRELLVHGIKRRIVMAVARAWSMPSVVADTDLLGMVPRVFGHYIAKHFDIVIHELPVPISGQHMYMMWNSKLDADPAHKWVREQMLKIAAAGMKPVTAPADPKPRAAKLAPARRPPRPSA
jgi:DNA-binding transcriptional LysR family regulator